jgi:hypothetical protein
MTLNDINALSVESSQWLSGERRLPANSVRQVSCCEFGPLRLLQKCNLYAWGGAGLI